MVSFIIVIIFLNTVLSSKGIVRLKVSTSQLENLVKTEYFVDKSDFIKEFLDYENFVLMISAPRRFGKSVNMELINKFCELIVDKNGTRVQRESTDNYKFFKFHKLKITKDEEFVSKHFGNYPVLFIDLKVINCTSNKAFIGSFKRLIRAAYIKHKYLLISEELDKLEKIRFREFYDKKKIKKMSANDLHNSLSSLSYFLFKHFEKTGCLVLLDGYDTLVDNIIYTSGDIVYRINEFITEMLTLLFKVNPYLNRALINGCVRLTPCIPTESEFVDYIPFYTNNTISSFYGFTEKEVTSLLNKNSMRDNISDVRMWYDGYRVQHKHFIIYNPLSIVKYLETKKISDYWVKSADFKYLTELCFRNEIQDKIFEINSNAIVKIRYLQILNVTHIIKLRQMAKFPQQVMINDTDVDLYMQMIADAGYFNVFPLKSDTARLEIPAPEIKQEIKRFVQRRRTRTSTK